MEVAVVRYNAGNIQSVSFALERMGIAFSITDDPEKIMRADKVVFPGVGEAGTTMRYLRDRGLDRVLVGLRQPFIGICLGMQLMCRHSEENDTPCLGIFDDTVRRMVHTPEQKVPHIGWNTLTAPRDWVPPTVENSYVYFVHSYYVPVNEFTAATTTYITPFSAILRKNNFYAVQFHPEKSSAAGQQVLKAFFDA